MTFQEQSLPVIDHLKKKGKCIEIASEYSKDVVYAETRKHFLKLSLIYHPNIVLVTGNIGSGKSSVCLELSKHGGYDVLAVEDIIRTKERTVALIKPDAYDNQKDEIISRIIDKGFRIVAQKEMHWNEDLAAQFYAEHVGKNFFLNLVSWMTSSPIYAMVLEKSNAIADWRTLAGPTNSNTAREVAPDSVRALYGTDGSKNAVHGSDSISSAHREISLLFGHLLKNAEEEDLTSLQLVKMIRIQILNRLSNLTGMVIGNS
jgi:nucleoside diphosphate kinase